MQFSDLIDVQTSACNKIMRNSGSVRNSCTSFCFNSFHCYLQGSKSKRQSMYIYWPTLQGWVRTYRRWKGVLHSLAWVLILKKSNCKLNFSKKKSTNKKWKRQKHTPERDPPCYRTVWLTKINRHANRGGSWTPQSILYAHQQPLQRRRCFFASFCA